MIDKIGKYLTPALLILLIGIVIRAFVDPLGKPAPPRGLESFSQLPPCIVAMEACGGAHFWGRGIGKLDHEVRLIAPQYVRPFVKRRKKMQPTPRRSSSRHSARECALSSRSQRISKPVQCFSVHVNSFSISARTW